MPLFSSIGAANTQTTNKGNERGWARARVITHGYVAGGKYPSPSPFLGPYNNTIEKYRSDICYLQKV